MNRLVVAAASFLIGTVSAVAADMAVKAPPPPAAVFSWAGFYAGGNVGYSWGESRNDWNVFAAATGGVPPGNSTCAPAPGFALCVNGSDGPRLEGVIGGLQAGYNWISGKYLLGLEGDLQYSGQKANQVFNGTFNTNSFFNNAPVPGLVTATYSESLQWLGTLRGRVGYVNDRWAFYATGGLAVGEVKINGANTAIALIGNNPVGCSPVNFVATACPFGTFSNRETRVGWTLGAGVEGMISANWSWKAEYLHVDLGKVGTSFATLAACWGGTAVQGNTQFGSCNLFDPGRGSANSRITDEIVRVGINYHFASGPVVAKH